MLFSVTVGIVGYSTRQVTEAVTFDIARVPPLTDLARHSPARSRIEE